MSLDRLALVREHPCDAEEFARAEAALGHPLPAELARMYQMANGFREPTNSAFLFPLHTPQPFNQETATGLTLHLRSVPLQPDFWQRAAAFSSDGLGASWCIEVDTDQVFEWWAEDGDLHPRPAQGLAGRDPALVPLEAGAIVQPVPPLNIGAPHPRRSFQALLRCSSGSSTFASGVDRLDTSRQRCWLRNC